MSDTLRRALRATMVFMLFGIAAPRATHAQAASSNAAVDSARVSPDSAVIAATNSPAIAAAAGASLTGLRAGVHAKETARPDRPAATAAESKHIGQDQAMMVVGLAGLIAGAIIGGAPGTIIMVGGAVVGLVGLYNYLQ